MKEDLFTGVLLINQQLIIYCELYLFILDFITQSLVKSLEQSPFHSCLMYTLHISFSFRVGFVPSAKMSLLFFFFLIYLILQHGSPICLVRRCGLIGCNVICTICVTMYINPSINPLIYPSIFCTIYPWLQGAYSRGQGTQGRGWGANPLQGTISHTPLTLCTIQRRQSAYNACLCTGGRNQRTWRKPAKHRKMSPRYMYVQRKIMTKEQIIQCIQCIIMNTDHVEVDVLPYCEKKN